MSLPRYPEYKDSGVEWLGEVPAHWNVRRLQDVAQVINGYPFDSRLFCQDGGYPLIRIRDLDAVETAARYAGDFVREALVENGDVLIGMDGEFNVGRWLGSEEALLNQRMCCVRSPSSTLTTFIRHALPIPLKAINEVTYATTVKHLSSGDVKSIRIALPDPSELAQISRFLDRETTRIDTLIAEQETLLALLAEKRQATISHAVTRGLDPNFPMKDSGIAWLGDVPAHWKVLSIKQCSPVQRGASPRPIDDPKYFDDDGDYAWVRISDVSSSGGLLESTDQRLSELGASLSVKLDPGSLFISIAGSVGKPCITKINACIHDGFVYFPNLKIPPMFLFRIFEAGACYAGLGKMGTQLNLNTDTVGAIQIAVPPDSELNDILRFLEEKLSDLDVLASHARAAASLLNERRSALISAAVTGQIDVRGLVDRDAA